MGVIRKKLPQERTIKEARALLELLARFILTLKKRPSGIYGRLFKATFFIDHGKEFCYKEAGFNSLRELLKFFEPYYKYENDSLFLNSAIIPLSLF